LTYFNSPRRAHRQSNSAALLRLLFLSDILISSCPALLLPTVPQRSSSSSIHCQGRKLNPPPPPSYDGPSRIQATVSTSIIAVERDEVTSSATAHQIHCNDGAATSSSDGLVPLNDDDDDDDVGRAFLQKLLELDDYHRDHGHCLVPKRYDRNPSLGNWVNKQRQNYRKFVTGKRTSMNEIRISALNERGFVWDALSLPSRLR